MPRCICGRAPELLPGLETPYLRKHLRHSQRPRGVASDPKTCTGEEWNFHLPSDWSIISGHVFNVICELYVIGWFLQKIFLSKFKSEQIFPTTLSICKWLFETVIVSQGSPSVNGKSYVSSHESVTFNCWEWLRKDKIRVCRGICSLKWINNKTLRKN